MEAKEVHSVDDLLVKDMQSRAESKPEPAPVAEVSNPTPEPIAEQQEEQESKPDQEPGDLYGVENNQIESKDPPKNDQESKPDQESSPIDEYGNPLDKPKMYSEEEVQKLIRERLSRVKIPEPQQAIRQQASQDAKDFQADPNSDQSWEDQLNSFVDRRIETREKVEADKRWHQDEARRQSEFEDKFTRGMGKYKDFHSVVEGKPITDSMMLAARSLENPAAFVYAAAKLHPQEIDRISRIGDPYVQASEVGRLHERMVKERKMISSAAKPLETPKGDVPAKQYNQPSLESRIASYGQKKQQRR